MKTPAPTVFFAVDFGLGVFRFRQNYRWNSRHPNPSSIFAKKYLIVGLQIFSLFWL